MARKLEYDTGDAALVPALVDAANPKFPIVVPEITDAADIEQAFDWLWQGADNNADIGESLPGLSGYLYNFNDRIKSLEYALQPSAYATTPSYTNSYYAHPKTDRFLLTKAAASTVKARFEIASSTANTYIYTLPETATTTDTILTVTSTHSAGSPILNKNFSGAGLVGGTISGAAISTGTINNTPIGGTTPNTGAFTTLSATGSITGSNLVSTVAIGTPPLSVTSTTVVTNLNADLLDGQQGSWYQDWANVTNKPDPVITLAGDLSGSVTLTDLASGTLTATIVANSVALGTDTTGNYVATIAGTANQVTVAGSGSETAAVTLSLPQNIHAAATPTFTSLTLSQTGSVTPPLVVSSTARVINLNADLLDGQEGTWYQDWNNVTNKPDPTITLAGGFLTGSVTLTDLSSGTLTATVVNDSITYAKIQNVSAQYRVLGRITTAAGDVEELTGENLVTVLSQATSKTGTGSIVFNTAPTFSGTVTATTFSGSAASLTSIPAGQLTGTIPSAVLGNSTVYIGSTAILLNRSTGSLALTGITSIDGNAATATLATNATNTAIAEDVATATAVYPTWVTANTGNLPQKTTSTRLSFVPSTGTLSASAFSGNGASLTNLTAGNLAGTIPSGVLGNSTVYIGTTGVALNRTTGNLALAGISSINNVAITAPASTATFTLASAKTFTVNNTLTLNASDGAVATFSGSGTVLYSGGVAPSDLNAPVTIAKGGTGINTAPAQYQILQGNDVGGYNLTNTPTFNSLTVGAGNNQALTVNGNFTVSGDYVIAGKTKYDDADITTKTTSATGGNTFVLDALDPVYATGAGNYYYTGAEYMITLFNATGRTVYKATLSAFWNGIIGVGEITDSSIVVYAETSTSGAPTITAYSTFSDNQYVNFNVTTSADATVQFLRIATKVEL